MGKHTPKLSADVETLARMIACFNAFHSPDGRADAEYLPGQAAPVGNEAMARLTEIRSVLPKPEPVE